MVNSQNAPDPNRNDENSEELQMLCNEYLSGSSSSSIPQYKLYPPRYDERRHPHSDESLLCARAQREEKKARAWLNRVENSFELQGAQCFVCGAEYMVTTRDSLPPIVICHEEWHPELHSALFPYEEAVLRSSDDRLDPLYAQESTLYDEINGENLEPPVQEVRNLRLSSSNNSY